jgi:hypothetical protein
VARGDPPAPAADAGDARGHLAPNTVFAELGGAGLLYSINYERLVRDDLGVRVGLATYSLGGVCGQGCAFVSGNPSGSNSAGASLTFVPLTISYVGVRARQHALELGGGVTLAYADNVGFRGSSGSAFGAFTVAMAGYRFHPVGHAGFEFRVGLAALAGNGVGFTVSGPATFGVLPSAYLSLGAAF